ncbi:hypothetical protein HHSLTHF2_34410 [Vreelandella venusta]|uniref:Uncharacterized protein n=1 Tax=Halomonas hydrothermalis TaxID=115561 RepID=A0A6F8U8S2_9GAMM|nr:hypothetical protein HHSLTHF2_34410 [Halomonas hydrothermalis]
MSLAVGGHEGYVVIGVLLSAYTYLRASSPKAYATLWFEAVKSTAISFCANSTGASTDGT